LSDDTDAEYGEGVVGTDTRSGGSMSTGRCTVSCEWGCRKLSGCSESDEGIPS